MNDNGKVELGHDRQPSLKDKVRQLPQQFVPSKHNTRDSLAIPHAFSVRHWKESLVMNGLAGSHQAYTSQVHGKLTVLTISSLSC